MVSGKDESADRQASQGGAPESEFGPSLNDFGPSLNDFGPAPVADGPGWSPAPGPQSPDLAWRPAGAPQFRAPDAWQPATGQYPAATGPSTGQYPAVNPVAQAPGTPDVEETVKIPSGGPRSAAVDVERTTRISDADSAAAERNSAPADTDGSADSWWRSAPSGFPPAPPSESAAGQPESLSWADDPIAKALAPKTTAPQRKPEPEPRRSWRKIGLIAGAAVTVLAVAGGVIFALSRGGADTAPTAGVTTGKPSPSVAALSCPAKRDGKLTIGNGVGGTGSGVDAILGFQYAFYVDRSGVKAHSFVVPGATTVAPAEVMQAKGIDQLKPGTTYCLKIVETGPEAYDVDITEHRVDGTTEVYVEHIRTTVVDGKHLIQSIE